MTVSDVLDGAFDILKGAPGTIIAFTAVWAVPVYLLGAWLQRDLLGGDSLLDVINQSDTSLQGIDQGGGASGTWAQMVLLFGPSLALVFVAAGLVRLVGAWHVGQDLTLKDLLRGSFPMAWPLLASWSLVHLAEGVGMLLGGFPGLLVMAWFLVTAPVIGAERLGPIGAMRRSARLTRRRFWPVLGLSLLSGLVATLFGYALGLVPTTISLFVGTSGLGWLVTAAAGILTSLITLPVVAGTTVLIYLDLRVRTEGLDLELDAREVLPQ
ncbi:MAG TPA: hypothetical protein VFV32_06635 [Acidimicrobiales bacterium]|nr:hypothetical protein [Acidimicrobiales bacterium]